MAASQVCWRKSLEILSKSLSHQIALITMNECNTSMQQPSSSTMPCTNVPIHFPLCPTSVSGNQQTIWKYNALYHLITEHSNSGIRPEIPGELLVKIFIHKK